MGKTVSHISSFKDSTVEEVKVEQTTKEHHLEKIADTDLEAAFDLLRRRCPDSWTPAYEDRANELHKMFMLLRKFDTVDYIDPMAKFEKQENQPIESKDDDVASARQLLIQPELWEMYDVKKGVEFFEILRHLTRFAPFKGRPFISAWLDALLPCLCRWMLLSADMKKSKTVDDENAEESTLIPTLKHFLGAFGQPGIVVCLADKGDEMLRTLKYAARAVEATGRGEVERYYWKRLTESTFRGTSSWAKLASLQKIQLKLSQLDHLPADWLKASNDQVRVFAEVVSTEITPIFEKLVKDAVKEKQSAKVKAGPPKTISRSRAKCDEYKKEFQKDIQNKKRDERWIRFGHNFEKAFGRPPSKSVDFSWNIMDYARVSVEVPTAGDALDVKKLVEDHFEVVCLKNGYNLNEQVKGSGYRDMKLLVKVEFDDLGLKKIPNMGKKTILICEIQVICKAWLENKITTSLPYKVLRSETLKQLCKDFSKYLFRDQDTIEPAALEPLDVIKSGYANLAKAVDFSDINGLEVLHEAAQHGWEEDSVSILVNELNVDPDEVGGCT